jgi:glycosyltransferase involved in cell wall biosynthesis
MPARKWKWRMRGAAYHFADAARRAGPGNAPDVVLASDFLNLCDWRAFAPRPFRDAPALLYFHENQVTYPLGDDAPVDFHYGWINFGSAFAADRVLFNSAYHREGFLRESRRVLSMMPDFVPEGLLERIETASSVFPVGLDFEAHREVLRAPRRASSAPVIIWNHRWEYDKDPDLMTEALVGLAREGLEFGAIVCGQAFKPVPAAIERLKDALGPRLLHVGFFEEPRKYLEALRSADFVLSTARQEFFGVAVVEALYMGCLPVLPHALSYPEIVPLELHDRFLYHGPKELHAMLVEMLSRPPVEHRTRLMAVAAGFDWKVLAPRLDAILEQGRS